MQGNSLSLNFVLVLDDFNLCPPKTYLCGGQAIADSETIDGDLDLALIDHVDDCFSCSVHGDYWHGKSSISISGRFLVVVAFHLVRERGYNNNPLIIRIFSKIFSSTCLKDRNWRIYAWRTEMEKLFRGKWVLCTEFECRNSLCSSICIDLKFIVLFRVGRLRLKVYIITNIQTQFKLNPLCHYKKKTKKHLVFRDSENYPNQPLSLSHREDCPKRPSDQCHSEQCGCQICVH